MAADVGGSLLGEVHEVGLDEMLRNLRTLRESDEVVSVGWDLFDRILKEFTKPRDQARYPVIEITGPPEEKYDGLEGAVICIDADGREDINRLGKVMMNMIETPPDDGEVDKGRSKEIVKTALRHVHLLRPRSMEDLIQYVDHLSTFLLDSTRHESGGRALRLIVIDNVTSYYWQTKLAEQDTELDEESQSKKSQFMTLVRSLQKLQDMMQCAIVATSWGILPQYNQKETAYRSVLPPVWENFVTLRLVAERLQVKKFPPAISIANAQKESAARQEAVERNKFAITVDKFGSEYWPEAMREAIKRNAKNTGFGFRIHEAGLKFDQD